MSRMHAKTRREALDTKIRDAMAKVFSAGDFQSILVVFSQYWNDGADDELHVKLVASRRAMPLWPHRCPADAEPIYDDEYNEIPDPTVDEGEACRWCNDSFGYLNVGGSGETAAFETYCHEYASQDNSLGENYLPYAIGRRRADGGIDMEMIGVPQRPALELEPLREAGATWIDDARARSLYELVSANPRDDGARRVLADYLLEHDHPHGELLSLSLADSLDGDSRSRLAALLDEQGRRWLGPLTDVIPFEHAEFERGFLAHAYVWATEKTAARADGHPAWGTVETIRMAPGSAPVLTSSMIALREVGMIASGHERLFDAPRPWAISSLRIRVDQPSHFDQLATTRLLPALRELVVGGELRNACLDMAPAAIEKLVLLDAPDFVPTPAQLLTWKTIAVAMEHEHERDRAGWELAFSGERIAITMVGWHPQATLAWLANRLRDLPEYFVCELVPSRYFAPVEGDIARLVVASRHRVELRR